MWVAGPSKACGTNRARRENPLGPAGVGAAPRVSPAVSAGFHSIDLFPCRNVSPKPIYSDDGNSCD